MSTDRFAGRVGVVTGGASGIGEALARLIVREGGMVVIADRQDDLGAALAEDLGDAASFVRADVSVELDIAAAVHGALATYGRLDTMCNNAGLVGPDPSIADVTAEQYRETLDVLLLGVLLGTKHAARAMIDAGRGGSIVNTSSVAGLRGGEGPHLYTVAKHAVIGLTRSSAAELAAHRIRVNVVAPGGVPTPMAAAMVHGDRTKTDLIAQSIATRSPLKRSSTPDDVAEAIAYLASDASGYITGQTLTVDAGAIVAPPREPRG